MQFIYTHGTHRLDSTSDSLKKRVEILCFYMENRKKKYAQTYRYNMKVLYLLQNRPNEQRTKKKSYYQI